MFRREFSVLSRLRFTGNSFRVRMLRIRKDMTEPEIVAELFKLYQARTDEIAAEEAKQKEANAAKPRKRRAKAKENPE